MQVLVVAARNLKTGQFKTGPFHMELRPATVNELAANAKAVAATQRSTMKKIMVDENGDLWALPGSEIPLAHVA